jgi:hypothetical protein
VLNAACQGRLTPTQLAQQLQQLDAYRGLARANPIAAASAAIADALPKTAFGGDAAQPGPHVFLCHTRRACSRPAQNLPLSLQSPPPSVSRWGSQLKTHLPSLATVFRQHISTAMP